jgi:hypothetical protein
MGVRAFGSVEETADATVAGSTAAFSRCAKTATDESTPDRVTPRNEGGDLASTLPCA